MGRVRWLMKPVFGLPASWLHTFANLLSPLVAKEFYRRPLPRHCLSFSSPEGRLVFQEALAAGHMEAYFTLAGQLCTQDEPSYCGLATLVMVLNALEMDPGRIWKGPWRWYHESMFIDCLPPDVITKGIVMDKFAELARCSGLHVDMQRVGPSQSIDDFRSLVAQMTADANLGILVGCYDRGAIGQTGTGHFAPIGGYHVQRELVFVFDTARFKYPPHWVPLALLWAGMGRVDQDTGRPRGYMLLSRGSKPLQTFSSSSVSDQGPDHYGLVLFGLSNIVQQAFLSPLSLRDPMSLGQRLRHVLDDWVTWLDQPVVSSGNSESAPLEVSSMDVAMAAVNVLLAACARHQPGAFFLALQPVLCSGRPRSDLMTSRKRQHDLSQDLLASPLGQAVRTRIVGVQVDRDLFTWMTSDAGPFHMSFVPGYCSATPAFTDNCPFNELSDAGLRLSLFLTCFLFVFPYKHPFRAVVAPGKQQDAVPGCSAVTPMPQFITHRQMLARIADDILPILSPFTANEISLLRASFSSLLSTTLDVSNQCCANHLKNEHHTDNG